MKTQQVLDLLEPGETSSRLLEQRCPGAEAKFVRQVRALEKTLRGIQSHFPDANIFVEAEGGFCLF